LGRAFIEKVRGYCQQKGFSEWELLALIDFETGGAFAPDVRNGSGFVGLIQFGQAAARDLGTTRDALAQMGRLEQLDFVFAYIDQREARCGAFTDLGDLYSSVLWPPGIGQPDDFVFFQQGDGRYEANASLDTSGDGRITKGEAVSFVRDRLRGGTWTAPLRAAGMTARAPGLAAAGSVAVAAGLLTYSLTNDET
jgi:hypothetical protein